MKTCRLFLLAALAGAFVLTGCGKHNREAENAAIDAASKWLELIDQGKFDESWEQSAPLFRLAISPEKWRETLLTIRKPMGENLSRTVKSSTYRTTVPGAPDGEYVIIQFKSSFENKKSAVETVTPMLTDDGVWRVSGYFVR